MSDQEGGRWRSVSPEGALRVGLRSGRGAGGLVEMGLDFMCVSRGCTGAHETQNSA